MLRLIFTNTVLKVILFSVAFAFVEASVVVYLRHLLGASYSEIGRGQTLLLLPGVAFLKPQEAVRIIQESLLLNTEMIREGATLVMLALVAALAAKNFKNIPAFFFLAFGIWDIFYYIFLRLIVGWPLNLTDTDIFFLLPVPWVGPVFVPIIISIILVLGSILYLKNSKS